MAKRPKKKRDGSMDGKEETQRVIDLGTYLRLEGDSVRGRRRVAQNLCVAVLEAMKAGRRLNHLRSQDIMVDPATCRVALSEGPAKPRARAVARAHLLRDAPSAAATDLAFYVCCLMGRRYTLELASKLDSASGVDRKKETDLRLMFNELSCVEGAPWTLRLASVVSGEQNCPILLYDVPAEFRRSLRNALGSPRNLRVSVVALALLEDFERWEARLARRRGRVRREPSSQRRLREVRAQAQELERVGQEAKGFGQPAVFWKTTLATALALGICSATNGFSPLDVAAVSLGFPSVPEEYAGAAWQYLPAAVVGCVVFNALLVKRHAFKGFTLESYAGSLVAVSLLMALTRALFVAVGRTGLL